MFMTIFFRSFFLCTLVCVAGCRPRPADIVSTSPAGGEPKITFREMAHQSGLQYQWKMPAKPVANILDLIGHGCAFLDANNDDNLDVLLVGDHPALFHGDGEGHFTPAVLPPLRGRFLGCATGDFNRDGFTDIYITAYRGGALLQNQSGKGFRDVTRPSGIAPQPWATSAAFADLDGDTHLDLLIGNYVKFDSHTKPQLCRQKGIETACAPRQYLPEPATLYKGNGKGGFVDATRASGFNTLTGKALGIAIADLDGSGKLSVSVANDEMPGDLMRQESGKRWENVAKQAGTATDNEGNLHGGMGTDWGDVDNDGRLDLFVATYQNETKNLYRNEGDGLFTDRSAAMGLTGASPYVTFGARFVDFDNDGFLDLTLANGHIQNNIEQIDNRTTFRQPTLFYRGGVGGRFTDVTSTLQSSVTRPIMGRGLAAGDFDNDGRVDVLVVDSSGTPLLLKNETPRPGNFVGIALSRSDNRSPLGATLILKSGERTWVRHCHTDGSYMSASDPRVVFGIGALTRADTVTVKWPNGGQDTYTDLPVNQYTKIVGGRTSP